MSPQTSRLLTIVLGASAVLVLAGTVLSRGCDRVRQTPSSYRTEGAPFASGTVEGRLVVSSGSDARLASWVRAEPDGCDAPSAAPSAVVWIEGPTAGAAPRSQGARLDLGGCGFEPVVSVVLAGSTISVRAPSAEHRIQAWVDEVRMFDAAAGGSAQVQLGTPGVWQIRCASGHAGEEAWVIAAPTPYAEVVGENGEFTIASVPVGHWTLAAWHPLLGTRRSEFDVAAKAVTRVDVAY